MGFEMKAFIDDIFAPLKGEILTIMIDLPHGSIMDNPEWNDRREMASEWLSKIKKCAGQWELTVNPLITYRATGGDNADLPDNCYMKEKIFPMKSIVEASTIIISMPEFSATAPLYEYSLRMKQLRVASMPGAARFMEETGLSADYKKIREKCDALVPIFNWATGAEVVFSTGHHCYFDLTGPAIAYGEDGILHPERGGTEYSCANIPAGEVYIVPEEGPNSLTRGDLPFMLGGELGVFKVRSNRIVETVGKGHQIEMLGNQVHRDRAWQNIAEFAIGVNDQATITGNVLQDEKAGFHWAYGRSDHLGGKVGIKDFISPDNVVHRDTVYATCNPVVCTSLEMIFPDGSKKQLIRDGFLLFPIP
jgi:hypothetical protein